MTRTGICGRIGGLSVRAGLPFSAWSRLEAQRLRRWLGRYTFAGISVTGLVRRENASTSTLNQ